MQDQISAVKHAQSASEDGYFTQLAGNYEPIKPIKCSADTQPWKLLLHQLPVYQSVKYYKEFGNNLQSAIY